ncbi:imidazole glycerol phosphate synthase subunit HisH [Methylomagnum ishizawai]|uniref:imidazole glycerol phosphate synthase subunit HisH n=1 Tax=Methylomagnum ishizawai TaxID=1760988 RepID=UPI001C3371D3|nr:imidazole glycerol phosphate synthase subunit HisH [Methylomagnum ishizawai]BBL73389.1 imidazole glycerol phosphate synthase subunit HisH 1 [Methylomagnum ishizawai]
MSSVAIIDYGMGNLHSIAKAVQHADPSAAVVVTDRRGAILEADRVVFPGVGAIRDCMAALESRGLAQVLREAAATKPLLGICLGMQALLDASEENNGTACLGLIPGRVLRFADTLRDPAGHALKIPHMGWNEVFPQGDHPLWAGIAPGSRFYFVHSYYARPANGADVAATANYPEPFAAALAHGNIFAVQFHPEKSQAAGLRLLANFLRWHPES